MNDFGITLPVGTHGIYKSASFYKTDVTEAGRTFVVTGGQGRECAPGSRRLTGYWLYDNAADTIDSYSLEAVSVGGKRIKQIVKGDPDPTPKPIQEAEPQKAVRRKR